MLKRAKILYTIDREADRPTRSIRDYHTDKWHFEQIKIRDTCKIMMDVIMQ